MLYGFAYFGFRHDFNLTLTRVGTRCLSSLRDKGKVCDSPYQYSWSMTWESSLIQHTRSLRRESNNVPFHFSDCNPSGRLTTYTFEWVPSRNHGSTPISRVAPMGTLCHTYDIHIKLYVASLSVPLLVTDGIRVDIPKYNNIYTVNYSKKIYER